MQSERGSILVLTVTFLLVLSMFGVASIHYAGLQNEEATKRMNSVQAFWIADGGIEKAKSKIKNGTFYSPPTDIALTFGSGTVYWDADQCQICGGDPSVDPENCFEACNDRWKINSQGTVNNQTRKIEAVSARYNIENAITSKGRINGYEPTSHYCDHNIDNPSVQGYIGGKCVQLDTFDFESVFGKTEAEFRFEVDDDIYTDAPANTTLRPMAQRVPHFYYPITSSSNKNIDPIKNLTIVDVFEENANIILHTDTMSEAAFLLIDTDPDNARIGCGPAHEPSITVNGIADFRGIIWIKGVAKFSGNPQIAGTVFVDGDPDCDTNVSGSSVINFDTDAIHEALEDLFDGDILTDDPKTYSWREI